MSGLSSLANTVKDRFLAAWRSFCSAAFGIKAAKF
jgi:hypothetical protein